MAAGTMQLRVAWDTRTSRHFEGDMPDTLSIGLFLVPCIMGLTGVKALTGSEGPVVTVPITTRGMSSRQALVGLRIGAGICVARHPMGAWAWRMPIARVTVTWLIVDLLLVDVVAVGLTVVVRVIHGGRTRGPRRDVRASLEKIDGVLRLMPSPGPPLVKLPVAERKGNSEAASAMKPFRSGSARPPGYTCLTWGVEAGRSGRILHTVPATSTAPPSTLVVVPPWAQPRCTPAAAVSSLLPPLREFEGGTSRLGRGALGTTAWRS